MTPVPVVDPEHLHIGGLCSCSSCLLIPVPVVNPEGLHAGVCVLLVPVY